MADKKKIVLIDDEVDICTMIKENLEETGEFDVVATSKPKQAKELCKKEKPDLIITDIVMPQMRDAKIIDILKSDPKISSIPVIIISGGGEMVYSERKDKWQWLPNRPVVFNRGEIVDERSHRHAAEEYNVAAYIAKPFTTEVLIQVISEVLKKQKKLQEQREEEEAKEEKKQEGLG